VVTVVLAVCALCALSFVVGVLLTVVVTHWRSAAAPPPDDPVVPAAAPPTAPAQQEETVMELRWPGELSSGAVHRNPVLGVHPGSDPASGVPRPDSTTSAPAQLRLVSPAVPVADDSLNEADVSGLRRRHLDTFEAPHHRGERQ
jgi:hypothetical protein